MTEPATKEAEKQLEDIFDEDSDEKDETDGLKPSRKVLPGAVPMFGGVDIFAGQKLGKSTKAKPQGIVVRRLRSLYCRNTKKLYVDI